jgi:hypothetical protein
MRFSCLVEERRQKVRIMRGIDSLVRLAQPQFALASGCSGEARYA